MSRTRSRHYFFFFAAGLNTAGVILIDFVPGYILEAIPVATMPFKSQARVGSPVNGLPGGSSDPGQET